MLSSALSKLPFGVSARRSALSLHQVLEVKDLGAHAQKVRFIVLLN